MTLLTTTIIDESAQLLSPPTKKDAVHCLIEKIPKVELHLHIEGTMEPEMVLALARRNGIVLKEFENADALRNAYNFKDLQSFLDLYYTCSSVLQTEEDYYDMAMAYLRKAHSQNVVHSEIFFDPQSHTQRNIPFQTVITGISRASQNAFQELGTSSCLIMCFLRHLSEEEALETLTEAMPYRDLIHGIGLDSTERHNPPQKFARVFELARQRGFKLTTHAGEEGPPCYIRDSLDILNVQRIDHGVACMQDPSLVERLIQDQIPLTVCPLSNVMLKVFPDLKALDIKAMLDQGLLVTINSDDPAYFGGYIQENYLAVADAHALTIQDIANLAHNSVKASFLNKDQRRRWHLRIDEIAVPYLGVN